MECYIHPGIDYTQVSHLVTKQRAFLACRLKENSQVNVIHDASELFEDGRPLRSALDAPGVTEAGWNTATLYKNVTDRDRINAQSKLNALLKVSCIRVKNFA